MGVVTAGSEEEPTYWRDKEREAREQESRERREAYEKAKKARDAERKTTEQALRDWSQAVDRRNDRRRNIGLTLAAVGAIVGLLLLWVAGHTTGFPETLTEALGTALLVAATVEVAARITRKLVTAKQKDVDAEIVAYLEEISRDVGAVSTDLMDQSMQREAQRQYEETAQTAEFKALLEDQRDRMLKRSSRSPAEERILRTLESLLATLPKARDAYYYGARAKLLEDRELEQIGRLLKGDAADQGGAADMTSGIPNPQD